MPVRAYPFERLPRVARSEAAWLSRLLRALPERAPALFCAEAEALLGARIALRAQPGTVIAAETAAAALPDPCCALWLEVGGEAQPPPLLCELPVELAALLVDRVLGGDGRLAHPAGHALDELSQGVLGYLAARLCSATAGTLRVRAVTSARSDAYALLGQGAVAVIPIALEVDEGRTGFARVLLPEATSQALARRSAPRLSPSPTLLDLTIGLCAHLGRATLRRGELDALGLYDVIVPDRCALTRDSHERWTGEVELHAHGSRASLGCQLRGAELIVGMPWPSGESPMSETKPIAVQPGETRDEPLSALAADAPLELCLELARFSLTVRELSSLRAGEVLRAGRAIGELVTLTAAGKPLARGELVDIDGEVGMRVLELLR